jgi:hypothetical protein
MSLNLVDAGRDLANDVNVVIEIPMHADPIKYEVDKATGALFVDRFVSTAMHYPCNYGYVPRPSRRRRPGGCVGDHSLRADAGGGGARAADRASSR